MCDTSSCQAQSSSILDQDLPPRPQTGGAASRHKRSSPSTQQKLVSLNGNCDSRSKDDVPLSPHSQRATKVANAVGEFDWGSYHVNRLESNAILTFELELGSPIYAMSCMPFSLSLSFLSLLLFHMANHRKTRTDRG
jgi:hypothetical protein